MFRFYRIEIKLVVLLMFQTRLSSLLKTAEDLHIKGLAEVSWRSDSTQNDLGNSGHSPGAATPGVETVLREGDADEPPPPKQRRRGRPPLDDPPSSHDVFTPKITCITGNVRQVWLRCFVFIKDNFSSSSSILHYSYL